MRPAMIDGWCFFCGETDIGISALSRMCVKCMCGYVPADPQFEGTMRKPERIWNRLARKGVARIGIEGKHWDHLTDTVDAVTTTADQARQIFSDAVRPYKGVYVATHNRAGYVLGHLKDWGVSCHCKMV